MFVWCLQEEGRVVEHGVSTCCSWFEDVSRRVFRSYQLISIDLSCANLRGEGRRGSGSTRLLKGHVESE